MASTFLVAKRIGLSVLALMVPLTWLSLYFDGYIGQRLAWISLILAISSAALTFLGSSQYRWISYTLVSLMGIAAFSVSSDTDNWLPQLLAVNLALFSALYLHQMWGGPMLRMVSTTIFTLIGLFPVVIISNIFETPDLLSILFILATLICVALALTVNSISSFRSSLIYFNCIHVIIRAAALFSVGMLASESRVYLRGTIEHLISLTAGVVLVWGLLVGRRHAWPLIIKTVITLFVIEVAIYEDFFALILLTLATVADFLFVFIEPMPKSESGVLADPLGLGALGSSVSFIVILACLDLADTWPGGQQLYWLCVLILGTAVIWSRSFSDRELSAVEKSEPTGIVLHVGFYILAIGAIFLRVH